MRLNSSAPGNPGAPVADFFQQPQSELEAALLTPSLDNGSGNGSERSLPAPSSELDVNTDIYSKVLVTAVYLGLFVVGTVGNAVTAFTLARKKSLQNLQSTVHYHLGSLALSDLLILLLAMPVELYNFIWVHHPWAFGDAVCRGYYFLRDACTYATALNVASLSVERYLAICHPFKAKTLMSRSRTKKFISAIWLASGLLAVPMLFTMGQQNRSADGQHPGGLVCTPIVDTATVKVVIQVSASGEKGRRRWASVATSPPFPCPQSSFQWCVLWVPGPREQSQRKATPGSLGGARVPQSSPSPSHLSCQHGQPHTPQCLLPLKGAGAPSVTSVGFSDLSGT